MRELPALVTVLVLVAPVASVDCYSVPDVVKASDGGTASSDGPFRPETSGSSSGSGSGGGTSSSGGSSGSSSGGGTDASPTPDASCTGILCSCNNANDCASGICAQTSTVGSALGHAGFCTQGCCRSADCPSGTVCYASGEGGQYCVDPTWIGRSKPTSNRTGGATCGAGSDCLSGLCVGGACADTCCSFDDSAQECASPGAYCVFGAFPGMQGVDTHFAPHCAAAGTSGYGAPCSANSDCQGGLCFQSGTGGNCTQPCRSQGECGAGNGCMWEVQGSDIYAACFPLGPGQGSGDLGAQCSTDLECLGYYCNTTNTVNACTGPCFTDYDCMNVSGWRCTPNLVLNPPSQGNYYVLGCGP